MLAAARAQVRSLLSRIFLLFRSERSELFALALALAVAVAGCRAPRRSCFRPLGPSERVALAISGRGRGLPGALGEPLSCSPLPLLSSPSERGEVQNDLVRAASLHPLSSGL
eukprot:tig00021591_g22785.t1